MAILDRFRSLPAHKHADPDVRLAHVESLPLDEREELAAVAREDESPRVRRAAVKKLLDPIALASIAQDDGDPGVRTDAAAMIRDIALEQFESTGETEGLAAVDALSDAKALSQVARAASRESVAHRALGRITETRLLGSLARHAVLESVRQTAFAALDDRAEILSVAMHGEFKDTASSAVEKLSERSELEQVAAGSTNKVAAKRARGLLRQLDERAAADAAAAAPVGPDAAEEAVIAERSQLLLRLQGLRTVEDLEAADSLLGALVARWETLSTEAPASDPAVSQRFGELAAALRVHLEEARAAEDERARVEAISVQHREERRAAERAAALAADEERTRKDAERRRVRLDELIQEIEAAAADQDLRAASRRLNLAQREWTDLTRGAAPSDDLAARHAALTAGFAARDAEAKELDARARKDGLRRLQQLLTRVEALQSQPEVSAKAAERALRDVRAALGSMPPLPTKADFDDAMRRLKAAQAALTPKVQELRAIEDWQRWANVGIQEALCEKMEALATHQNAEEIARRVRELQQQWRQAADVPRAQGEALWRRFKTAHDVVWARCEAQFAAEAQARAENLAKKIVLCGRAEALTDSTSWVQTAEEIKRLQADWKAIGPVSRGQEKAIWDRFRVACDRFFTRRHDDLAQRKAMWTDNLAKKEALCAQAEALAESTEWDSAAADIKRLQGEWKAIGPVKKTRSEAVWQRFRAACDRFFVRYSQRHEIARGERAAAREAICAELEALARPPAPSSAPDGDMAPAEPPADLLAQVRTLRGRWQQEVARRGVDPDRAAVLDHRFASAHDLVVARWPVVFGGTDLDPEANRARMESLVQRLESLASSVGGPAQSVDQTLSPATRLATMLKEALAANTIGGKVDEESRFRAALEDMRQAQAAWSRIGPVAEPARRVLADRFQRACRRISERAVMSSSGASRTGQSAPGRTGVRPPAATPRTPAPRTS
jgi:hypothetical protein